MPLFCYQHCAVDNFRINVKNSFTIATIPELCPEAFIVSTKYHSGTDNNNNSNNSNNNNKEDGGGGEGGWGKGT